MADIHAFIQQFQNKEKCMEIIAHGKEVYSAKKMKVDAFLSLSKAELQGKSNAELKEVVEFLQLNMNGITEKSDYIDLITKHRENQ